MTVDKSVEKIEEMLGVEVHLIHSFLKGDGTPMGICGVSGPNVSLTSNSLKTTCASCLIWNENVGMLAKELSKKSDFELFKAYFPDVVGKSNG